MFSAKPYRFSLFSFTWAFATLMHVLSFPRQPNLFWTSVVISTASLVILKPDSIYFFVIMLFCSVIKSFVWLPFTPNHIFFELIINTSILFVFAWLIVKRRFNQKPVKKGIDFRIIFFNSFAPFARLSLLILYFYAVLHKLNWDYFNPKISCGPFLLEGFGSRLPIFLHNNEIYRVMAVWGTLIIEAAIPILFLFKRTRSAGIFLGLTFHYFLSIHPHNGLYSFSSLLFALYCLFLPPEFSTKINEVFISFFGAQKRNITIFLKFFIVALVVGTFSLYAAGFPFIFNTVLKSGLVIWLTWGLVLIFVYAFISFKYKFRKESFCIMYKSSFATWITPLIVLFNGANPYLGLKTENSFSMFSNLRTEGGTTNHLFLPLSLHVTNLQEDLVEITDTNYEGYKEFLQKNQLITYFEFHRIASMAKKNFFVEYKRDGKLHNLIVKDGVSSNPEITKPLNFWAYKFINFRPIDKGPCLCKH